MGRSFVVLARNHEVQQPQRKGPAASSNRRKAAKILKKALAVRAQAAQVIREARRELKGAKAAAVRRHFALRATCAAYLRGEVGAAAMLAALVRA